MPYSKTFGKVCAVVNCDSSNKLLYNWKQEICNEHHGLKHSDCACLIPFRLHKFPSNEVVRKEWIAKLKRKDFQANKHSVICSKHFIDGQPTEKNPVPQVEMGYDLIVKESRRKLVRNYSAGRKKIKLVEETNAVETSNEFEDAEELSPDTVTVMNSQHCPSCTCGVITVNQETQWEDLSLEMHNYAQKNVMTVSSEEYCKRSKRSQTEFSYFSVELLTDADFRFYTSLPQKMFYSIVSGLIVSNPLTILPFPDQILLVLMKLRLALLFTDLGWRFKISKSSVSKIFRTNIKLLSAALKSLICWLPREVIRANLPEAFLNNYPKTTCIIDCSEIFVQKPRNLRTRAQAYSRYKSHNTLKILAAIAPNGAFMFLSDCYGGRASDKFIVTDSTFLSYLLPGDEVMADRGFTISEELAALGVTLNIPAFTRGKAQLSESEVTTTRRIATVRIDVERAFRRLKQFRQFQFVIPLSQIDLIDDMLITCTALCNLQAPLRKK